MIGLTVRRTVFIEAAPRSNIAFTTDDRMNTLFFHNSEKIDRTVHDAVIRNGT